MRNGLLLAALAPTLAAAVVPPAPDAAVPGATPMTVPAHSPVHGPFAWAGILPPRQQQPVPVRAPAVVPLQRRTQLSVDPPAAVPLLRQSQEPDIGLSVTPPRQQVPGTGAAVGRSGQQSQVAVSFDAAAPYRSVLNVGPVLRGREIEHAARSGLPVRVRIRVELWKDRFIDQLVDSASWNTVIAFEPIGEQFFVRSLPAAGGARRYSSFAEARQTVESVYPLRLQPRSTGRYYYTATVQVERLSLSDLEELERWLQGELHPAVSGQRSIPNAIGQGAKRLMLRLLDMPTRRYDTRSERFHFP
jgi:hypothetical protein